MDTSSLPEIRRIIAAAVREDLGHGDVTTLSVVLPDARDHAVILSRERAVIAGLPLLPLVFGEVGGDVRIDFEVEEGGIVAASAVLCRLQGPTRVLLAGERVALNFLQHLSGVATATRAYVDAVAGTKARIVDTRKTLPGLRLLEKYAVRVGGGSNHRFGLDDGILIKENHIAAAGGVRTAVERARAAAPHVLRVEIECESLQQVDEAVAAGAEVILLDNMTPAQLSAAVKRIAGRAMTEASGGITLKSVGAVAETGVDLISVGAITHSVRAIDLSMRLGAAAC